MPVIERTDESDSVGAQNNEGHSVILVTNHNDERATDFSNT